jgi:hypothetical protein
MVAQKIRKQRNGQANAGNGNQNREKAWHVDGPTLTSRARFEIPDWAFTCPFRLVFGQAIGPLGIPQLCRSQGQQHRSWIVKYPKILADKPRRSKTATDGAALFRADVMMRRRGRLQFQVSS